MILDMLALVFCGGVIFHESVKSAKVSEDCKQIAKSNGMSYYYNCSKKRNCSVETDEPVSIENGYVRGVKTGRIYEDTKESKIDKTIEKVNKELAEKGHYVEIIKTSPHSYAYVYPINKLRYHMEDRFNQKSKDHFIIYFLDNQGNLTGETKDISYNYWYKYWWYRTEIGKPLVPENIK